MDQGEAALNMLDGFVQSAMQNEVEVQTAQEWWWRNESIR